MRYRDCNRGYKEGRERKRNGEKRRGKARERRKEKEVHHREGTKIVNSSNQVVRKTLVNGLTHRHADHEEEVQSMSLLCDFLAYLYCDYCDYCDYW